MPASPLEGRAGTEARHRAAIAGRAPVDPDDGLPRGRGQGAL